MSNKLRKYKKSGFLRASVLPDYDIDPNGYVAYKNAQLILDSFCELKDESVFLPFGVFSRVYNVLGQELTLDHDSDAGDVMFIPANDEQLERLLSILVTEHGYEVSP